MKRLLLAYDNNHEESVTSMGKFKAIFNSKIKSKVHNSQYIRTEITNLNQAAQPFKFLTSRQVVQLLGGV